MDRSPCHSQPGLSPGKKRQASLDALTAVILCSYCPVIELKILDYKTNDPTLYRFRPQEKERAIIGLVFLFFFLLKADSKKTKTPTWSDEERGAEHTNNS